MQLKIGKTISIKWEHILTIKIEQAENTKSEKKTVTSANVTVSNSSKG